MSRRSEEVMGEVTRAIYAAMMGAVTPMAAARIVRRLLSDDLGPVASALRSLVDGLYKHDEDENPLNNHNPFDGPLQLTTRSEISRFDVSFSLMDTSNDTSGVLMATAGLLDDTASAMGKSSFNQTRTSPPDRHVPLSNEPSLDSTVLQEVAITPLATRRWQDGVKMINQYELMGTLGKGSGGKVKLAYDTRRSSLVAIKVVRRTLQSAAQLNREIDVMLSLRHKNLVALYEVIYDHDASKVHLVMQYVDGGPVLQLRQDGTCDAVGEADVIGVARQLCAALEYLHLHRIVHRDIKPDNVLRMRDGRVFLTDFGISEGLREVQGYRGTPLFMAPEVVSSSSAFDGFAADVWSLGVTLYTMLVGRLPFPNVADIGVTPVEYPHGMSRSWRTLLSSMLEVDPRVRARIHDLRVTVKFLQRTDAQRRSVHVPIAPLPFLRKLSRMSSDLPATSPERRPAPPLKVAASCAVELPHEADLPQLNKRSPRQRRKRASPSVPP